MKKALGIVFNPWLWGFIGILAISILIWFLGPAIPVAGSYPLEPTTPRVAIIGAVVVFWLLHALTRLIRAIIGNRELVQGILDTDAGLSPEENATAEEVERMRSRFKEAMTKLKKLRVGTGRDKRRATELPWYMLIGAPGCGKTTLVTNAGLKFPFAELFGVKVRGFGGTADCDWFITEQAVILDTAGRFVTQDSEKSRDQAGWEAVLARLRRYRRRRPLNGAIVAVSIPELLSLTAAEREAQAANVRARIQELHNGLGVRFPVYIIFTKCDLVSGFMEFFENYRREERAQVWGHTFGEETLRETAGLVDRFPEIFARLNRRLTAQVPNRLQQEPNPSQRGALFSFPHEFASLGTILGQYLSSAFSVSSMEVSALVRGIYFTSGTQEGTPLNRLQESMAAQFGLPRVPLQESGREKQSFFVEGLIKNVVIGEAGLAGTNLRLERVLAWIQRGGYVAALLVVALAGAGFYLSYTGNLQLIESTGAQVHRISERLQDLGAKTDDPADVAPILEDLQCLGQEAVATASPLCPGRAPDGVPSGFYGLGLDQREPIAHASSRAYFQFLAHEFLPRVILQVEGVVRGSVSKAQDDSELLYESLRTYLLFGDYQRFVADIGDVRMGPDDAGSRPTEEDSSPGLVRSFLSELWRSTYGRDAVGGIRSRLSRHFEVLLGSWPERLPFDLDGPLVDRARSELVRTPLHERVYARLKSDQRVLRASPAFRIFDTTKEATRILTMRASNSDTARDYVRGFYTYDGYFASNGVKDALTNLSDQMSEECWILGNALMKQGLSCESGKIDQGDEISSLIREEVQKRYMREFIKTWNDYLSRIDLVEPTELHHAVDLLNILSSPGAVSPLQTALERISEQTSLVERDGLAGMLAKAVDAVEGQRAGGIDLRARIRALLNPRARDASDAMAKTRSVSTPAVDQHFAELHRLIKAVDDRPVPFSQHLLVLGELYQFMHELSLDADQSGQYKTTAAKRGNAINAKLERLSRRTPEPVGRWMRSLVKSTSCVLANDYVHSIDEVWRSAKLPICQATVSGGFPLDRSSPSDISVEEFASFFGPSGVMAGFFADYLQPFVDTNVRPWRLRSPGACKLPLSEQSLRQFELADKVRDVFFRRGEQPRVDFSLKPIGMDPEIDQFTLDIEGQVMQWSHGRRRETRLTWPASGAPGARLSLSPIRGDSALTTSGPWGVFRLFALASARPLGQNQQHEVIFDLAGRKARWLLSTPTFDNPFNLPALTQFRCPQRLATTARG